MPSPGHYDRRLLMMPCPACSEVYRDERCRYCDEFGRIPAGMARLRATPNLQVYGEIPGRRERGQYPWGWNSRLHFYEEYRLARVAGVANRLDWVLARIDDIPF